MIHTDRTYWEEMDVVDGETTRAVENVIDNSFNDIMERYKYVSEVTEELDRARLLVQNVVWASMNVPYPRDPDRHIDRVIDNVRDVYYNACFDALYTKIILAEHRASVIKRVFRRSFTDPSHTMCQRRLAREYEEFTSEVNRVLVSRLKVVA